MAMYNGFSSINKRKKYRLTDFDLVIQDLYNHLYTRPGERVMNPNFGCIIWGLLFEPLNAATKNLITQNLTEIINAEPRVSTTSIFVSEYEHGLMVQIELLYLQTNQTQTMKVAFDRKST